MSPKKTLNYSAVTVLTLVNSAAVATPLSGQTFKEMYTGQGDWRRLAIFFGGIAVLQFLVVVILPRQADRLAIEEGTIKFAKFFSNWYRGSGDIRIYCTDIEWLEGEVNEPILSELKRKAAAGRVEIFLRKYGSITVLELLKAGAKIYLIPQTVNLRTRMSLREDEESLFLILRLGRTREDGAKVAMVRPTTDRYWCDLAKETMDACRTGQQLRLSSGGDSVEVVS